MRHIDAGVKDGRINNYTLRINLHLFDNRFTFMINYFRIIKTLSREKKVLLGIIKNTSTKTEARLVNLHHALSTTALFKTQIHD